MIFSLLIEGKKKKSGSRDFESLRASKGGILPHTFWLDCACLLR